jgi:hypothetical protein
MTIFILKLNLMTVADAKKRRHMAKQKLWATERDDIGPPPTHLSPAHIE